MARLEKGLEGFSCRRRSAQRANRPANAGDEDASASRALVKAGAHGMWLQAKQSEPCSGEEGG